MEKRLAIIEISNREVRLIIGNVVNDKPVILYQTARPVTGLLSRGEIVDMPTLTQIVASLANVNTPYPASIFEGNTIFLI